MARASGLHPEGHRFEPGRAHKRQGPEAKASGPEAYLLALLGGGLCFLLYQLDWSALCDGHFRGRWLLLAVAC